MSIIGKIKDFLHPERQTPPGFIRVRNSRIPVERILTGEQLVAYQAFLKSLETSSSFQTIKQNSESRSALLNRGLQHEGVAGEPGPVSEASISYFSPQGFDRCYVANLGDIYLIVKGGGLRSTFGAYLEKEHTTEFSRGQYYKPIDINPSPDLFTHLFIGGTSSVASSKEIDRAATQLTMAYSLGETDPAGAIIPLALRPLKSFAVKTPIEEITLKGWNFFTHPKYMDANQRLTVAGLVQKFAAEESLSARAASRFIQRTEAGKKVSRLLRWIVGRAFMKLTQPAVYEYVCKMGHFRIGHLYEQLISNPKGENQGKIKRSMDEQIRQLYSMFSEKLEIPRQTNCDLTREPGRIDYLRQIYSFGKNAEAVKRIAVAIASEVGKQLGILHGSGGNAGGHVYAHHLGKIDFQFDGDKIAKMTAVETGEYEVGAPGGGSTRPDNLGFGLRDLDCLHFCVEGGLKKVIESYPQHFRGLDVEGLITYFHQKMVQQSDLDLLFVTRLRSEVRKAGGFGDLAGAFPQLIQSMGGDRAAYESTLQSFWSAYQKYYALAKEKYAPEYFKKIDADSARPKFVFHSPAEDLNGPQLIEELFQREIEQAQAA